MTERLEQLHQTLDAARAEVRKVILGQDEVIDAALIVILTRQHALIEGVPGVAKTLLARTLAHVLGCEFARIQFTPDLMPADITGTNVFNFARNEFTLVRGPVFTSFLLADEINRAPAKTQSALLQAMQERTVTIDRETHALPRELHRLRHAESHRIRRHLSAARSAEGPVPAEDRRWPRRSAKMNWSWRGGCSAANAPEATPRTRRRARGPSSRASWAARAKLWRMFPCANELAAYIVDIARRTRTHESVLVGAGPRATQALVLSSRAHAALAGRDFVTPDDVKAHGACRCWSIA